MYMLSKSSGMSIEEISKLSTAAFYELYLTDLKYNKIVNGIDNG